MQNLLMGNKQDVKKIDRNSEEQLTFWEHLDVLRFSIIRIIVVTVIASVAAFCFKEELFRVVLAPINSNFLTYRLLHIAPFQLHLINTNLTEQFLIHMKVATIVGILIVSPYLLYILFRFVSPALYPQERCISLRLISSAYFQFLIGVAVNYFILFPLTIRFLGTYQVSNTIDNMLTISSYIDTLLMMSLMFGFAFEIPVISYLLAYFGMLRSEWMKKFRRHSIVVILIIAAIITPTADIFTLLLVSFPICILYEISIRIVATVQKTQKA